MRVFLKKALSLLCSAALTVTASGAFSASADWEHIGYMGDLNRDKDVTLADLVIMSRHLHGVEPLSNANSYHVKKSFIGIHGADGFQAGEYFVTADINQDGQVDVFDMIQLRKNIISQDNPWIWQWESEQNLPGDPLEDYGEFIGAPVDDVEKYLPSHGEAKLLIIYADFEDCKYEYNPSPEDIERIAFGPEDESSNMYPFESATAFYARSSKGSMHLSGNAFPYTAKESVKNYHLVPGQKKLVTEALAELDAKVDFHDYDGDNDGFIDTVLLIVPKEAGDETWWPAAVPFSNDAYKYDGLQIGHMITGNCQINSATDYRDFTNTILHEMGHCMGLPDYYLYDVEGDHDGLHGTAGSEMMDDSGGDFSCVSKLQLGWYKKDQVMIFEPTEELNNYTLYNAQSERGNTLIIPCGELDDRYHCECIMLEYTTKDANNSSPPWYVQIGEGVRAYHADMTLHDNGWWVSYKYASGSEFTNNYNGRRFIRLINDYKGDNIFKPFDFLSYFTEGFAWYDENDEATKDVKMEIMVGNMDGESCTLTIQSKWE